MVNVNQAQALAQVKAPVTTDCCGAKSSAVTLAPPVSAAADTVTLSAEAQALAKADVDNRGVVEDAKMFTYAALGIDHPEPALKAEDDAYKAGQAVGAAASVVGMGLLL
ncbi:hypothetical protein [Ferrimonas senticii]|uniref:hypothetical protein n=1 Tax=Ferrimonas senticii TaxID=394566 RepID=UPI0003F61F1E|nr:hypothetical protein [Ferrimonas senticii]